MMCLTVQQPWASLLLGIAPAAGPGCAPGVKNVENRSWSTSHRGNLLIHAGQKFDAEAMRTYYADIAEERFPRGVILGMVELTGMVPPGKDCGSPWGVREQWNWAVRSPRVFSHYVAMSGRQGLFEVQIPQVVSMAKAESGASTRWWDGLPEGDREWFIERVAILEFEAKFSRLAAVHEAYAQFVAWKHAEREEHGHDERDEQGNGIPYFGVSESWWHQWDGTVDK